MFVAVLFDAIGIGLHPSREAALEAAAEQFPGKPATVIRLLDTRGVGHRPNAAASLGARRYSTDMPHGHISLSEANDLRTRLTVALTENPLRLRDLRKHMGPSESSLRNFRTGTTKAPQLRIARLIDTWLDGLSQFTGQEQTSAAMSDIPENPVALAEIEVSNAVAHSDLGGCLLDVAVSRGVSRRPAVIATEIGVDAQVIQMILAGSEQPSEDDRAKILGWMTA
ncbi:MAG: hypothetical protein K9K68_07915 [Methylococcaceae bacterium]|nr:hypothetical protein [Methylococcaceae bacterium]